LAAAVYGASEGLRTIVVEREAPGGQAGTSSRIENYLGFPAGVSGDELASRALQQARRLGAEILVTRSIERLDAATRQLHLDGGDVLRARTIILATGVAWRRLSVEGFDRLAGKGVSYGAARSEAPNTHGLDVQIVGGGNSAGQAAIWLSRGGALVTLLHRRADLRETMSDYLIGDLARHGVAVRDRSEIAALHGSDGQLEAVTLRDGERVPLSYLFLFLGAAPCTDWLGSTVARDDHGFVLTGADAGATEALETSVAGVFAAGDARSGSLKRCATAVGEGAAVVRLVHERLTTVPA
jgi:thioredoxin reductase (NADPH)